MYFNTTDESIKYEKDKLNKTMVEFDRWASQNPSKLIVCMSVTDKNYESSKEYRDFKQDIKMSRLKIKELEYMNEIHKNQLRKRDDF